MPAKLAKPDEDKPLNVGAFRNLGYGLRLSVTMYDTAAKEAVILKNATDTQNFSLLSVSGDSGEMKLLIAEQRVSRERDWDNEAKIQNLEIEIEIP
jgi:hypothetical protein